MTDRSDSGGVGTETPSREARIADLATALRLPLDEVTDTVGFLLDAGVSPGWVVNNYPDVRRVLTEDAEDNPLTMFGRTTREEFILDIAKREKFPRYTGKRGGATVYHDCEGIADFVRRHDIDRVVPDETYAVGWYRLLREMNREQRDALRYVLTSEVGKLNPEDPDTCAMVSRLVNIPRTQFELSTVRDLVEHFPLDELRFVLDLYNDDALRNGVSRAVPRHLWTKHLARLEVLTAAGVPHIIAHPALIRSYDDGRTLTDAELIDGWNTVQEMELPDTLAAALLGVFECHVHDARCECREYSWDIDTGVTDCERQR